MLAKLDGAWNSDGNELLINWHYFSQEVLEFEKLTFLTGKTGTGKSTIIDALQLVLLADTSGNYFNKSANGKSRRTLLGYLRGELGMEIRGFSCNFPANVLHLV